MHIQIQLFAAARTTLNSETIELELPENATVAELRLHIAEKHPKLAPILPHSRIALNHDYAAEDATLPADAEIALIPPVSGG